MKHVPIIIFILLLVFIKSSYHKTPNIDVTKFGAKPNDMTDDTQVIQKAVDYAAQVGRSLQFPKGTFLINANPSSGTIQLHSNQEIRMDKGTILKVIPNKLSTYYIFQIKNKENIIISGGKLKGDRFNHQNTEGEYGHGIYISGNSKQIVISNLHVSNFWGDGLYIGGNKENGSYPSKIKIINCIANNNRRQGLSITAGKFITIQDSTFSNTNGTEPEAGIDLERNPPFQLPLEEITITNNKFINNNGYGLMMVYTSNNLAENNQLVKNKKGGIYLGGNVKDGKTMKNIISNNSIKENGGNKTNNLYGNGIFLNYAPNNFLTKNTIFNNNKNGVELLNYVGQNSIKKNIISGNKEAGIQIWGGLTNNKKILVQENTIQDNFLNGLSLSHAVAAKITNNTFRNNGKLEIYLENVIDSKLEFNNVKSSSVEINHSKNISIE